MLLSMFAVRCAADFYDVDVGAEVIFFKLTEK